MDKTERILAAVHYKSSIIKSSIVSRRRQSRHSLRKEFTMSKDPVKPEITYELVWGNASCDGYAMPPVLVPAKFEASEK